MDSLESQNLIIVTDNKPKWDSKLFSFKQIKLVALIFQHASGSEVE